jgi:KDO2-lipid IV(A) lauroyltransferase
LNALEYILFLILEKTVPILPLSFSHFLAEIYAYVFYYIIPIRKKTAISNLKLAFPEKDEKEIHKIVKGVYKNVLIVIFEFFYMRKLKTEGLKSIISVTNPEKYEECLARGKGVVVVSAHFGNWELMAHGVARVIGHPVYVIVKKQSNEKLDVRINEIRESGGNKMIEMQNAPRGVLTALRENKIVAILGDQTAPKDNSVKVHFFVDGVPTFEGAARFAIKTGASVLFAAPVRNKDYSYTVEMKEIDMAKYKDYTDENIKALTQEHTSMLEAAIRKNPDHWLWFHRRFKHVT